MTSENVEVRITCTFIFDLMKIVRVASLRRGNKFKLNHRKMKIA
jgi:hypothetical protein